MTVTEAFQTFKSELELPDRKQKQAAAAQQAVREATQAHLEVPDSFLTGSYARYTKIDPLNDIDVFLVRNGQPVPLSTDGSGVTPAQALDQVVSAVRRGIPGAAVRLQSRSVNIGLAGLEFGFDLIPAWLRSPDGYWIPDRDEETWLPTDPKRHGDLLSDANARASGKLKPLIKMMKHWSRHNLDLLRSFHLELICVDIFKNRDIASFQLGVATGLVQLTSYVGKTMFDPVYGVSRVDKPLSADELVKLLGRVSYDARNAVGAIELESQGRDDEAMAKWKHIFVSGFPQ